ncbi:MAG: glycoside hydrolase family 20 zincin-like fold domain-containing protein [Bryobacteraceae bacterium]
MKRAAIAIVLLGGMGQARVLPTPRKMESGAAAVTIPRGATLEVVTAAKPGRMVEIAVDLIRRELAPVAVRQVNRRTPGVPAVELIDTGKPGAPQGLSPEVVAGMHFGQSYTLETLKANTVRIAGSGPAGVLYGAATLVQLAEASSPGWTIPPSNIVDYPTFRYRAAADWLLRAELNRWAYDWGDGARAYAERIKRKLDFCVRFKINMVFFDGFGWSAQKRPGYAAMMRELNAYARDRGIRLMYGGFGANFEPRKVEPEFHIGAIHLNRRSYPDGPVYACFGEGRTPDLPTLGTCRSNDALQREIAREFEEFVRSVEPGALYIHHEDTGHYETTQRRWAARCDDCRRKWPNPDFAAADGGAGAMAHGYANILAAIRRVRNADTGYDARIDCTVAFISPPYGVDSGRSGLGDEKVDPDLNWNKTLEFWANVVSRMPHDPHLEVGFREIFANRKGEQWMDAYRREMLARSLNPNVFLFFLGGADQYSPGSFNYPFTGNSVMNGLFDGAEAIYNFNGGLHQEPQQVINAEYSWNSHAPGRTVPATFAEGLRRWQALMMNEEMPEAVFGPMGVFPEACRRIYGTQAGELAAQFYSFAEDRTVASGRLPAFYPAKVYPLAVLWRFLQLDAAYWDREPGTIEQASLRTLKQSRGDLQRQLAAYWRQQASVNQKARPIAGSLLASRGLRTDAREDVRHLLRTLDAGTRISKLLAAYHEFLGSEASSVPAALWSELQQTEQWIRSQPADFTDPKGGDIASWHECLDALRSRLAGPR